MTCSAAEKASSSELDAATARQKNIATGSPLGEMPPSCSTGAMLLRRRVEPKTRPPSLGEPSPLSIRPVVEEGPCAGTTHACLSPETGKIASLTTSALPESPFSAGVPRAPATTPVTSFSTSDNKRGGMTGPTADSSVADKSLSSCVVGGGSQLRTAMRVTTHRSRRETPLPPTCRQSERHCPRPAPHHST